jgi:hypothetical protein
MTSDSLSNSLFCKIFACSGKILLDQYKGFLNFLTMAHPGGIVILASRNKLHNCSFLLRSLLIRS